MNIYIHTTKSKAHIYPIIIPWERDDDNQPTMLTRRKKLCETKKNIVVNVNNDGRKERKSQKIS